MHTPTIAQRLLSYQSAHIKWPRCVGVAWATCSDLVHTGWSRSSSGLGRLLSRVGNFGSNPSRDSIIRYAREDMVDDLIIIGLFVAPIIVAYAIHGFGNYITLCFSRILSLPSESIELYVLAYQACVLVGVLRLAWDELRQFEERKNASTA